jgi:hypothetical protein
MSLGGDLHPQSARHPTQVARDTGMNLLLEAADALDDAAGASENPEEVTRFSALADRARKYVAPKPNRPASQ